MLLARGSGLWDSFLSIRGNGGELSPFWNCCSPSQKEMKWNRRIAGHVEKRLCANIYSLLTLWCRASYVVIMLNLQAPGPYPAVLPKYRLSTKLGVNHH